jgi:phosphatidylserine decarboxylase
MQIRIVKDGWPWILVPLVAGAALIWGATLTGSGRVLMQAAAGVSLLISLFMLYFHRDPLRTPPEGEGLLLAGADGVIRRVENLEEKNYLNGRAVRISIYLNPFNVHTNRVPMAGTVKKLAYSPGKHLLTISNAASEHNEHSSIFLENQQTRCLLCQIVGPIVRRVVYWLEEGQSLNAGDVFGMMKFGSRLDMYFPEEDINEVCVKAGDKVVAGVTVVALLKQKQ